MAGKRSEEVDLLGNTLTFSEDNEWIFFSDSVAILNCIVSNSCYEMLRGQIRGLFMKGMTVMARKAQNDRDRRKSQRTHKK